MEISGNLFYKGRIIDGGIKIEEGVITEISKNITGNKIKGLILPAAIDSHVHFRDFEEKHKETIETGSLSALFGGACVVIDQPNTLPRVEDAESYLERMKKAIKSSYIHYALNIGLTENNSEKIGDMIEKIETRYRIPAIGEVFLENTDKNLQIGYETLIRTYSEVNKLITVHAEDPGMIRGRESPNYFARPPEAEITAVKKVVGDGTFHFCHISTPTAAELIENSKSTFEVTPHHLLLSIEKLGNTTFANVNPPLRGEDKAESLLKSLNKADVIASDHAPHTVEEKKEGFPGFPGVETMYPLMVLLVEKGITSLDTVVNNLAVNPARIFGFEDYGGLETGKMANIAVFDLSDKRKIKADDLHSMAGWTPFENFEAIFPQKVFLAGVEAMDGGEVLIEPGEVYKKRNLEK